jgi:hypothetical protein
MEVDLNCQHHINIRNNNKSVYYNRQHFGIVGKLKTLESLGQYGYP